MFKDLLLVCVNSVLILLFVFLVFKKIFLFKNSRIVFAIY